MIIITALKKKKKAVLVPTKIALAKQNWFLFLFLYYFNVYLQTISCKIVKVNQYYSYAGKVKWIDISY